MVPAGSGQVMSYRPHLGWAADYSHSFDHNPQRSLILLLLMIYCCVPHLLMMAIVVFVRCGWSGTRYLGLEKWAGKEETNGLWGDIGKQKVS